ncbi:MAG: type II secretion system protein N [Gammaproteobacteria bacterium]
MSQRTLLIATGTCCFLLFAIALAPARIMANLVPPDTATLTDLSGTIWRGRAQAVGAGGIQLHDLSWKLHVPALLIGRVSLSLDVKWGSGYVRGDMALGLSGEFTVSDLRAAGSLVPVLREMNLTGNTGDIAVDIKALDIADLWPTRIVGSIRVGGLPLDMLGVSGGTAGSYELVFDIEEVADDGAIPGVLSDGGGPLEVMGELRLMPPRDYVIEARVKARPDAPADLAAGLMLIGPTLPDGSHEFRMSGSL